MVPGRLEVFAPRLQLEPARLGRAQARARRFEPRRGFLEGLRVARVERRVGQLVFQGGEIDFEALDLAGQARQPVKSLSGGERNRLLLACLFARPSDLLVLDEPTNDLDLETLDLLVETLDDYPGTLILVSHDRDVLDRLATGIIAIEAGGRAIEYAGGYSDTLAQQRGHAETGPRDAAAQATRKAPAARAKRAARKLGYKEQRELARLPGEIERLEIDLAALEDKLADPELYERDPEAFEATAARLEAARARLSAAETRWLELEARREELEAARNQA